MLRFAAAGGAGMLIVGCILFIGGTLVLVGWPHVVKALPMPARIAIGTGMTFVGMWVGFGGA
jgi:hypothetical protein